MAEHYDTESARRIRANLVLRGATYDHREEIKAAGGIWSPALQAWLVKDEAICHKLGAQFSNSRTKPGWWLRTLKRRRRKATSKPPRTGIPTHTEHPHGR